MFTVDVKQQHNNATTTTLSYIFDKKCGEKEGKNIWKNKLVLNRAMQQVNVNLYTEY